MAKPLIRSTDSPHHSRPSWFHSLRAKSLRGHLRSLSRRTMRFALATHHGTGLCGAQKRLLTTALLSALAGDAMSLGTHYEYDAHKVELIAAFPSVEPPSQPCAPAFHSLASYRFLSTT